MTRIKVAHITTIDLSLRYLLEHQLQSLQEAGFEVVGVSAPGGDVDYLRALGIPHMAVAFTRRFSPLADLKSLWRLYRLMRRERFTIVHTHTPKPGLLGQLAARLARVPIVVNTLHGFYFHDTMKPAARRFYITLEKIAARCSDSILSQNEEDIQTAIQQNICRPEKIKYLGNGIDLSQFDPDRFSETDVNERRQRLGIPAAAPVVGFVGRLAARRKGFLDFLQAGQHIARRLPAVRFLIVGAADTGKQDAVDPSVVNEYGLADHCLLLGSQPNDALPILYRLMHVLVLPSLLEGVPRVVMEAAAMGVPAVVTDVRGNREAVDRGRSGVLVPYGAADALAAAILDLLQNPQKAAQMGRVGVEIAADRFDERVVFDRVKAEYRRLLKRKGMVDSYES